eukprot:PhM_4_TR18658/c0_g1_i1/m.35575
MPQLFDPAATSCSGTSGSSDLATSRTMGRSSLTFGSQNQSSLNPTTPNNTTSVSTPPSTLRPLNLSGFQLGSASAWATTSASMSSSGNAAASRHRGFSFSHVPVFQHDTNMNENSVLNTSSTAGSGRAPVDISPYAIHPTSLCFTDPDMEQRFVEYSYKKSVFIGGQLYMFIKIALPLTVIAVFFDSLDMFRLICASLMAIVAIVQMLVLYRVNFASNRTKELIYLISFGVTSALSAVLHSRVQVDSNLQIFNLLFDSILIPQLRFCRVVPVAIVSVVGTLFIVRAARAFPDNSEEQPVEMLWWCFIWAPALIQALVEKRTRAAFEHIDCATSELQGIEEHKRLIQNVLASYYPRTPTEDLLVANVGNNNNNSDGSFVRHRYANYPGTALIAVNVVRFTPWSRRTENVEIVQTLATLCCEADAAAHRRGVERIATVGDTYLGAIFSRTTTTNVLASSLSAEEQFSLRCVNAIKFGVDAAQLPQRLNPQSHVRVRVGVDAGDVIGGFVGSCPPIFDLFGATVENVRLLERTGEDSRVHVSHIVLSAAQRFGRAVDATETSHRSTLLTHWLDSEDKTESLFKFVQPTLQNSTSSVDASQVASITRELAVSQKDDTTTTATGGSANNNNNRSHNNNNNSLRKSPDDEESRILDATEITILLRFHDSSLEPEYVRSIYASGVCLDLHFVLGVQLTLLAGFHVAMAPDPEATWDRVTVATMYIMSLIYMGVVSFAGSRVNRHLVWLSVIFYAIPMLASILVSDLHLKDDVSIRHSRSLFTILGTNVLFAPLVCFDQSLMRRVVVSFFGACVIMSGPSIRNRVRSEVNEKNVDPYVIVLLIVVSIVFYSAEHKLRSGFAAVKRVDLTMRASGKYAKTTRSALEVMVPAFVVNRLMQQRSVPRTIFTSELSLGHTVWEYKMACVVVFEVVWRREALDVETEWKRVYNALEMIERVAGFNGLHKVKSWGTKLLCVGNVEGTNNNNNNSHDGIVAVTRGAVLTYLTLISLFAEEESSDDAEEGNDEHNTTTNDDVKSCNSGGSNDNYDDAKNVHLYAGVHCGGCFGAVIGAERGVTFDLFGDTVTTSLRLCRPNNQHQQQRLFISAPAFRCLGGLHPWLSSEWGFTDVGAIRLRGKRTMRAMVLVPIIAINDHIVFPLPPPSSSSTASGAGIHSRTITSSNINTNSNTTNHHNINNILFTTSGVGAYVTSMSTDHTLTSIDDGNSIS